MAEVWNVCLIVIRGFLRSSSPFGSLCRADAASATGLVVKMWWMVSRVYAGAPREAYLRVVALAVRFEQREIGAFYAAAVTCV
jgi:hypothetical protein